MVELRLTAGAPLPRGRWVPAAQVI